MQPKKTNSEITDSVVSKHEEIYTILRPRLPDSHARRGKVKEETGHDVTTVTFNSSEFYEKANTLMLNFSCIATSENISSFNREEVDRISWFSWKVAEQTVYPDSLAHHFLKEWMRKEGHL